MLIAGAAYDKKRVVFSGENFVVYDVVDRLPRHANFPRPADSVSTSYTYARRARIPHKLNVHQAAGGYAPGWQGAVNVGRFFVRDPIHRDGRWIGNGRGWPAFGYTFWLAQRPEVTPDQRWVIYQCNPLDLQTVHTGGENAISWAICLQGLLRSRHIRGFRPSPGTTGEPSSVQMYCLDRFIVEYAKPVLGVTAIGGHFNAKYPKPTCPGDTAERYILALESGRDVELSTPVFPEPPLAPELAEAMRDQFLDLSEWPERQAALVALGADIGKSGPKKNGVDGDPGYLTRMAIESCEGVFRIPVNGVWDDRLEFHLQLLLIAHGVGQAELAELLP